MILINEIDMKIKTPVDISYVCQLEPRTIIRVLASFSLKTGKQLIGMT